jgi:hypothetical protein
MKANRRTIKAARSGDRIRLTYHVEQSARRYAKRFRAHSLMYRKQWIVARSITRWLDRNNLEFRTLSKWSSIVARHKERFNGQHQQMIRRQQENDIRREEEEASRFLDYMIDLMA